VLRGPPTRRSSHRPCELSAIDAYRIASGEEPLVSSRGLLWASAGLVVLSVLIARFVTLPSPVGNIVGG
jgi:hypothetical protein